MMANSVAPDADTTSKGPPVRWDQDIHPDPHFTEVDVRGMCTQCDAWLAKYLQPGETVVETLAGYQPGRFRIPCSAWLMIVPLIFYLIRWVLAKLNCVCMPKWIVNDRVQLALTSRRRVFFWHLTQTGRVGGAVCGCCAGNRNVSTATEVAIFKLDALKSVELGYARTRMCSFNFPMIPWCREQYTAQLALHFDQSHTSRINFPFPTLVTSYATDPNIMRSAWEKYIYARPAHMAMQTGQAVVRWVMQQLASAVSMLHHSTTSVTICLTDSVVQHSAPSALGAVQQFEAALMAVKPGILRSPATTRATACSAHFAMLPEDSEAPLVEHAPWLGEGFAGEDTSGSVFRVNVDPKFVPLSLNESIMDAHAMHHRWTFKQLVLTVATLGLYWYFVVRPMLQSQGALVVTTHRIIEVHSAGSPQVSVNAPSLLFCKRWFLLDGRRGVMALAQGNTCTGYVALGTQTLQVNMHASQPWWSASHEDKVGRLRMKGFLSFLQDEALPPVQLEPSLYAADPTVVDTQMLDCWRQSSVQILPDEYIVATLRSSLASSGMLTFLCTLGFRPYHTEQFMILTNKRVIGFLDCRNKPFVCCWKQDSATVAFWAPISELGASHMHGGHHYVESLWTRLFTGCCPRACCYAGYTSLLVEPGALSGFPVVYGIRQRITIEDPGVMENQDVDVFFHRLAAVQETVDMQLLGNYAYGSTTEV